MSSPKFLLIGALALTMASLTACKQGGDSNSRTRINKALGQNKTTPAPTPSKDTLQADVNKDTENGITIGGSISCQNLKPSLDTYGWKVQSIQSKETTQNGKTLNIVFYTLKNSTFENPVLYFKKNALQATTAQDLENFSKWATQYNFDPILMDARGAGCSTVLPDLKTLSSRVNDYGSSREIADAELIRKALLNGKKWKVLGTRSGGAAALRYAQLHPEALTSLHIADFTVVQNSVDLESFRLEQEAKNFKSLLDHFKITDNEVTKAQQTLDASKCQPDLNSCHELLDLKSGFAISSTTGWQNIAELIKNINDGTQKTEDLLKEFQNHKKYVDFINVSKFLDLSSDKNLSGCTEALKAKPDGILNSCRLQKNLSRSENTDLKNKINYVALDLNKISQNLTQNKIPYYLVAGQLSSLYPFDLYQEQEEVMNQNPDFNLLQISDMGSEVIYSKQLFDTLNK